MALNTWIFTVSQSSNVTHKSGLLFACKILTGRRTFLFFYSLHFASLIIRTLNWDLLQLRTFHSCLLARTDVMSLLTQSRDPFPLLHHPSVYSCCLAINEVRHCTARYGTADLDLAQRKHCFVYCWVIVGACFDVTVLAWRKYATISSHLCLCLQSGLLLPSPLTETVYAFPFSLIHTPPISPWFSILKYDFKLQRSQRDMLLIQTSETYCPLQCLYIFQYNFKTSISCSTNFKIVPQIGSSSMHLPHRNLEQPPDEQSELRCSYNSLAQRCSISIAYIHFFLRLAPKDTAPSTS
jgi:hypothetical protein